MSPFANVISAFFPSSVTFRLHQQQTMLPYVNYEHNNNW